MLVIVASWAMDSHVTTSMNVKHPMLVVIMLHVQMFLVHLNVLVMMAIRVMDSHVLILTNARFKHIIAMQTHNVVMFQVLSNVHVKLAS